MVLYVLLSLVILSIVMRYPLIEHERHQTDSYYIHQLSDSIVDDGYARWIIHPLSVFGYYPLSYPSGAPFLFAEFSMMTELTIEASVLLGNVLISILFCLSVFLLSRQFFARPVPALLSTFFIITGARFVDTSYWNASARAILVIFVVLVLLVLLRSAVCAGSTQMKFIAVASGFLFACLSFHHMAVLLTVFGIAYLLCAFQIYFISRTFRTHRAKTIAAFNVALGVGIVLAGFLAIDFLGELAFTNLRRTSLFDFEPALLSVLMNMGAVYVNQIGFITIFAVVGLPFLMRRWFSNWRYLFLLSVLLVFIPLLGNTLYVSMILSSFVGILGVMFILHLSQSCSSRRCRSAVSVSVVVLLVSSLGLTYWTIEEWNSKEYMSGDQVEVDNQLFNDAAYLSTVSNQRFTISNNYVISLQLSALTGAYFIDSGTGLVLSGVLGQDEVRNNVSWSEEPFPRNLYVWFTYANEPNVDYFVYGFMIGGADFLYGSSSYIPAFEYFSAHSSLIIVIDNDHPSAFVNAYFERNASLPNQLADSFNQYSGSSNDNLPITSYLTYSSAGVSIYALRLPA